MANPIKLQAEVEKVGSYGEGVYQVSFRPIGKVPRFKAGQFLHLTIDPYDPAGGFWPESRVFSIASCPGQSELTIVYSVKGRYTRRMEEYLIPGKTVWLKLPYGSFIIEASADEKQDVVLVAGGTGISPFLPYLQKGMDGEGGKESSTRLYYGVRKERHILFRTLLEQSAAKGLCKIQYSIESEIIETSSRAGIDVRKGQLDIKLIKRETENLCNPVFYLSGPPAMIRAFKSALIEMSIPIQNIKIDEWE